MQQAEEDGWESVPQKKKPPRRRRSNNDKDHNNVTHILPWISPIPPTKQTTAFDPFMILLCGIPGSGKSTLAHALQYAMPYKFVRINQDDLNGNRRRCEELARQTLEERKCPVIDRCNFDVVQREHFIAIANSYSIPIDCIVLETDTLVTVDQCIQRCQQRRNHPGLLPNEARGVVIGMHQQMQAPAAAHKNKEGIRNVTIVSNPQQLKGAIMEYLNQQK